MVPGSFVNLKVPPFKGKASFVQSSDWLDFEDNNREGDIDQFLKYTILIQRTDVSV